jgi:hypothetical protein
MKKIFTTIFLIMFLFYSISLLEAKENNKKINKKCFIVTAYYSPLINQKYYIKGSYIRDIILN